MSLPVFGRSCAIVAFLIAAQALFVAAYVTHERTIYYWDHAMYFNMARGAYGYFLQDFTVGWAAFRQSFANNYNLIFALPSFVTFALFGTSRLIFILTNYFVFFLGYEIAVAFFLRNALKCDWALALIASLATAMLIPPLWLPLLEGYPDSGAAACLVLAAALTFDKSRQTQLIFNALTTGVALGFAVLLRRHFAYPAIALLLTIGVFTAWDVFHAKKRERELRDAAIYCALCGAGFAGILALIAPDFVRDALTINYGALYLSYKRPVWVFLRFVLGGFGFGLLLIAASGLVFLARINSAGWRLASFTALYAFLWIVIWCAGPDQMGHHYVLHAIPLFVSIGIAGWYFYLIRQKREKRYAIGAALAVFLIVNSTWALWFSPSGVWPNDNGTPGILSAARPPIVRTDYDEWKRLADYLRRTTDAQNRIMMIGSSFVFNQDLMHSVYADILRDPALTARFVFAPEVDHESPAPLNAFAAANIYLVPTPAQYHLDPESQRVITAAANQFPPPPERLAMFQADDEVFHLENGVNVRVWRRNPWTPDYLFAALADIRRGGPQDPNFAQDWVTLAMPLQAEIHTDGQNHTSVTALLDPAHKDMRLFFDYALAGGNQRLDFTAASNCPDPKLDFAFVTGEDYRELSKKLAPDGAGRVYQPFAVPTTPHQSHFLELDVSTTAAALCHVEIRDLRVEIQP